MTHRWTEKESKRISELWKDGYTKYQVARAVEEEFGFTCTPNMVLARLGSIGVRSDDVETEFPPLTDFLGGVYTFGNTFRSSET